MIAAARFVAVSGAGFVADILLALFLRGQLGIPLPVAATLSFVAIAVANYLAFEFFVFRNDISTANLGRLVRTMLSAAIALAARLAALSILLSVAAPSTSAGEAVVLFAAALLSLATNFFLVRTFAFRGR